MRELEFELGYLVVLQGYLRVKAQRGKEKSFVAGKWWRKEKRMSLEALEYA